MWKLSFRNKNGTPKWTAINGVTGVAGVLVAALGMVITGRQTPVSPDGGRQSCETVPAKVLSTTSDAFIIDQLQLRISYEDIIPLQTNAMIGAQGFWKGLYEGVRECVGDTAQVGLSKFADWYDDAIYKSDPSALFKLGCCCCFGLGTRTNEVEAAKMFQTAMRAGCVKAQCMAGVCYVTGKGLEKKRLHGLGLLKDAVKKMTSWRISPLVCAGIMERPERRTQLRRCNVFACQRIGD